MTSQIVRQLQLNVSPKSPAIKYTDQCVCVFRSFEFKRSSSLLPMLIPVLFLSFSIGLFLHLSIVSIVFVYNSFRCGQINIKYTRKKEKRTASTAPTTNTACTREYTTMPARASRAIFCIFIFKWTLNFGFSSLSVASCTVAKLHTHTHSIARAS